MTTTLVQVVAGLPELRRHAAEITRLVAVTAASANLRLPALLAWLRHRPGHEPWLVLVRRGDELRGAALLARQQVGLRYRFTNLGEHPLGWVSHDGTEGALGDAVTASLAAVNRPWTLLLHGADRADPIARHLGESLPHARWEAGSVSPRIVFEPGRPLRDYLSRNTRSAVAKARNRIAQAGVPMDVAWSGDADTVAGHVPEMIELYQRRNAQTHQGEHHPPGHPYWSYFADMITAYAADGGSKLLTVRLDGALASYALCVDHHGLYYVYSNRMDPKWGHFSPGTIANAEVVRAAYADDAVRGVDWGPGVQRYKLSGSAQAYQYWSLRAASSRMLSAALTSRRRLESALGRA